MENSIISSMAQAQELALRQELRGLNAVTARFGLTLTEADAADIAGGRAQALRDTGRVELGGGIAGKLAYAFCDSPYLTQENYKDTLLALQEAFYYFKGEALETLSDDELIDLMRKLYDNRARGDLDYLCETTLEDLCRNTRFGFGPVYEEDSGTEECDEQ